MNRKTNISNKLYNVTKTILVALLILSFITDSYLNIVIDSLYSNFDQYYNFLQTLYIILYTKYHQKS